MARIIDALRNSIVYMYYSTPTPKGGSGFLTSVREDGWTYLYAVTNRHLIRENFTCPRILANNRLLQRDQSNWKCPPIENGPDLAVSLLPEYSGFGVGVAPIEPVPREMYLSSDESSQRLNVGVGDDAFMVGRFPPSEAAKVDSPVVRFGNISIWPAQSITAVTKCKEENHPQDGFLVEMRSYGGYSGSPVFASVGGARPYSPPPGLLPFFTTLGINIKFIGVHRAHLLDWEDTQQNYRITAIALVVPDSALVELLDRDDLREERTRFRKKIGSTGGAGSGGLMF